MQIAEEKQKYYIALNNELKKKYKNKRIVEDLFMSKKNDEWTFYMSLKRQMVKKNNAAQLRVGKLLNRSKRGLKDIKQHCCDHEEENLTKSLKVKQTKAAKIHLDVYSEELKKLIGRLNDETIDAADKNPSNLNLNRNVEMQEQAGADFDSNDDMVEMNNKMMSAPY